MRHRLHKYKVGSGKDHRKALMSNLAVSLFTHGAIETTLTKAKALRQYAEKLITCAKSTKVTKLTLYRNIAAKLYNNFDIARKLVDVIGVSNAKRPGGYTRIVRSGFRVGDGAPKAVIELVEKNAINNKK